ncbi:MAG: UPF0175 family protein [Caldilineaceae bacterium]|nr:UPF0175 family protein [Caldilineaceae bacterium]
MNTLTVELQMPQDVISLLDVAQADLPQRLKQLITLELYREGYISAGKGAEIIGVSKIEFIQFLAENGIHYLDQTAQELLADVVATEKLLKQKMS